MLALATRPTQALSRISETGTGGVRDACVIAIAATTVLRLPDLARAFGDLLRVSPSAGLQGMIALFAQELRVPVIVAVACGVAITLAAGRRRDPSIDIELGAACAMPFILVRAAYRGLRTLVGPMSPLVEILALAVGATLALVYFWVASGVARQRAGDQTESGFLPRASLALALSVALAFATFPRRAGGTQAPNFTLRRIDGAGGQVELAGLRGRIVLLDFWATWCSPCLQMLPTLHEVYREWHDRGVEVVGVNSDGPGYTAEVKRFLADKPAPYPIVVDDRDVGGLFQVSALPTLVVVGKDGTIVDRFTGITGKTEIEDALARAAH